MADFQTHEHDVLVIGAGGAGLRAAIDAASVKGCSVGLVCKRLLGAAPPGLAPEDTCKARFSGLDEGGRSQRRVPPGGRPSSTPASPRRGRDPLPWNPAGGPAPPGRAVAPPYWKPADRPVAFVITAQSGFRASMARSTSSAPSCTHLYNFVHICTILYTFV